MAVKIDDPGSRRSWRLFSAPDRVPLLLGTCSSLILAVDIWCGERKGITGIVMLTMSSFPISFLPAIALAMTPSCIQAYLSTAGAGTRLNFNNPWNTDTVVPPPYGCIISWITSLRWLRNVQIHLTLELMQSISVVL